MRKLVLALLMIAGSLRAEGEKAGEFDYYVLALSWTPTWCALENPGNAMPPRILAGPCTVFGHSFIAAGLAFARPSNVIPLVA